jgi:Na+/proline symporter
MMTWKKASGTGAIIAAWSGLILAVITWLVACSIQSGSITIDNLGKNEPMLAGNLVAILSSGIIHFVYSCWRPQVFSFDELDERIRLVENDLSGLSEEDKNPEMLDSSYKWIKTRGLAVTTILLVIWPLASIPARTFSRGYFKFWVFVAIIWGFLSAIIITILPLWESSRELMQLTTGLNRMRSERDDQKGPSGTKTDHDSGDEDDGDLNLESLQYCALKNPEKSDIPLDF